MTALLRAQAREVGWLLAGCLAGMAATGRVALGPLGLVLVMGGLLVWYRWGEASVPGGELDERQVELREAVAAMAELAGARPAGVVVVEAGVGEFDPPEGLNLAGRVAYTAGELAEHPLSRHLAVAARQLAVGQAPPRYSTTGLLATGAALGLLGGLHQRYGGSAAFAAAALVALLALAAAVVAAGTARAERRGQVIEQRARELLGLMRDRHPEAFRDLAERLGLTEPGLVKIQGAPPTCRQ